MTKRPYPCGGCGGSGLVVRQRKYVDPKGKVRTEDSYEVCKSCSGSGTKSATIVGTTPYRLDFGSPPWNTTTRPPLR